MYASSSVYSAESRAKGYKPFEYWKGPKTVSWTYYKENHKERTNIQPDSPGISTSAKPSPAHNDLGAAGPAFVVAQLGPAWSPLQPDYLHAAREAVPLAESVRTSDIAKPQPGSMSAHRYGGYDGYDGIPGGDTIPLNVPSDRFSHQQWPASPPPTYAAVPKAGMTRNMDPYERNGTASRWNYRTWSRRVWVVIAIIIAIVIIVIVVPAVVVTRNNRYPDYTPLNYTLSETYSGSSFFNNFDYFDTYDPSDGFVHYVDPDYATTYNLTYATSSTAVVKVDNTIGPDSDPNASTGRFSVRLQSKTQYNTGLFVFDVKHTPYGCATWPALWLTDPSNWPYNGEIDVMESVNNATSGNSMTLHTSSGCDMGVKRLMTGSAGQSDCNNATNDNTGCGVTASSSTYGESFNAAGGGVMAVEWRAEGIRMWQFGRANIPADITAAQSPDPNSWGTALADFPDTDCNIGSHFRNQSIIVDIDLCGSLTNAVWSNSGCPYNCTYYVANFPSAFDNAYWEFGNFWIYTATTSS